MPVSVSSDSQRRVSSFVRVDQDHNVLCVCASILVLIVYRMCCAKLTVSALVMCSPGWARDRRLCVSVLCLGKPVAPV